MTKTDLTFDAATVDATARPTARVPQSAVVEVRFRPPWLQGTGEERAWWAAVDAVLERRYSGDSLAAVVDSGDASVCLDLQGVGGSWLALYPAARRETIEAALRRHLDPITEEAGVEPAILEIAQPRAGIWGDDVTQVLLE